MKSHILLGLAALSLVAFAPTQSKAEGEFRVYVDPGYHQDRPYDYRDREHYWHRHHHRHSDEYYWYRRHHPHFDDRDYYERD